jgi:oligopeptide/dipeptide ABC transporter ATP-binding protein
MSKGNIVSETLQSPETHVNNLLEVRRLHTWFPVRGGVFSRVRHFVKAVQDADFSLQKGEVFSLVGESGCGKSTLGNTILGLVPATSGEIVFDGTILTADDARAWQAARRKMQVVFQNPDSSLNPRSTVEELLTVPMRYHKICPPGDLRDRAVWLLEKTGLHADYLQRFPHAFSGGQKQRIAIARALSLNPELLVCDEITSALDVSVQAQILELLAELKKDFQLTLLFISHDLSVVRMISDRIAVMYLGRIVEQGPAHDVFGTPYHPYTKALLDAVPGMNSGQKPRVLSGDVPSPVNLPKGCVFCTRCPSVQPDCHLHQPAQRISGERIWYCPYSPDNDSDNNK